MKKTAGIVFASLGMAVLLICAIAPFYYYHQAIAVKLFAAIGIGTFVLVLKENLTPLYIGLITVCLCIAAALIDRMLIVSALLGLLIAVMMFTLNGKGLPIWMVLALAFVALWYGIITVGNQFSRYYAGQAASWYGKPEVEDAVMTIAVNYIGILAIDIGLILSVVALCFSRSSREKIREEEARKVKPVQQREDDWTCPCGRHNTVYTTTCVCGRSKREALTKKVTSNSWTCTCGRENPNYTSTCVCGKNKRDIG